MKEIFRKKKFAKRDSPFRYMPAHPEFGMAAHFLVEGHSSVQPEQPKRHSATAQHPNWYTTKKYVECPNLKSTKLTPPTAVSNAPRTHAEKVLLLTLAAASTFPYTICEVCKRFADKLDRIAVL